MLALRCIQQSIAYRMSRAPAVWRYAASARRAGRDMLIGLLLVRRRQHLRRRLRMSRIVITGATGAGKTTLLLALQARGYTIVGDSARTIIQDRRRRGLSPRPDPYAFAQEALRMDIENFVHHAASPGPVFFERGVLDALCGLDRVTPLNESELNMWLSKYQYFPKVFVLPPWKAIYENDAERDHTFEHAESVNRIAQEWYRRSGYQVLEFPCFRSTRGVRLCCKRWQTATPNNSSGADASGRGCARMIPFHNRPRGPRIASRSG